MTDWSTFSIVVPIYQNEKNIPDTVQALLSLENRMDVDRIQLVFVDDGSTDESWNLLLRAQIKYPLNIKLVRMTRNFGQTPAIQAGLRYADGDYVGIISADLQDPYELFIDMFEKCRNGAKYVIGERRERQESIFHRTTSNFYWRLVGLTLKEFPEIGYDFCTLDRQVVEEVNRLNEKNTSIFPLIYWLGYQPVKIPTVRKARAKGKSQWTAIKKVRLTMDTLIGFTYIPVRFMTFFGSIIVLVAFFYLGYGLINYLIWGASVPGWLSLLSWLFLFGGLIIFSLGIIGEYLWRILDEVRARPPFLVEQVLPDMSSQHSDSPI